MLNSIFRVILSILASVLIVVVLLRFFEQELVFAIAPTIGACLGSYAILSKQEIKNN